MIIYLELLQHLGVLDCQMIIDGQVNQPLYSNHVDRTHSFFSSIVHLPSGETPDIGGPVGLLYLKPNSLCKSCFGLIGNAIT